ncbi:hypothetical protein F5Y02DRAFT_133751 [Annulohypoxylon stygium]|nr:hypothetical protein F5Y02DRAFT_133751 [Annulohypoxylon stygium]
MIQVGVICRTYSTYPTPLRLKRRNGHSHDLMAADTNRRCSIQMPLFEKLSTEVLILIFNELRNIDPRALASARRLSRRIETIVTPILFESICLNERIVSLETETYFPRMIQGLCSFTKHVEVKSDLDPVSTSRLLNRLHRLSSLRYIYPIQVFHIANVCCRWRYVGTHHSGYFSTPSNILSLNHINRSSIKVYIDDLPLHGFGSDSHDIGLQAIPTLNLVSLKMGAPIPSLTTHLDSLKRLLVEAWSIETFHYNDRGQGTQFSFQESERLPAFQELSLRSYDWNHSSDEVTKHWDFSRLRQLTLIDVPLFPFLNSISFSQLRQLQVLHCEDFSTHLPDRRSDATGELYKLILQIRSLHTLKVTCHTTLFPISGLICHADSLRVLSFRDYVGFGDERWQCPTLSIEDLSLLSNRLICLRTIELDMDATLCEPDMFLGVLCNFLQLDTLILHTQTVLQASEESQVSVDPDYDAVMKILSGLTGGKKGRSWRSITVNVGGWKPVMVRRISEAWQQQNRRGFFAERRFVLEKDAATGDMTVRENVGVDNNTIYG